MFSVENDIKKREILLNELKDIDKELKSLFDLIYSNEIISKEELEKVKGKIDYLAIELLKNNKDITKKFNAYGYALPIGILFTYSSLIDCPSLCFLIESFLVYFEFKVLKLAYIQDKNESNEHLLDNLKIMRTQFENMQRRNDYLIEDKEKTRSLNNENNR